MRPGELGTYRRRVFVEECARQNPHHLVLSNVLPALNGEELPYSRVVVRIAIVTSAAHSARVTVIEKVGGLHKVGHAGFRSDVETSPDVTRATRIPSAPGVRSMSCSVASVFHSNPPTERPGIDMIWASEEDITTCVWKCVGAASKRSIACNVGSQP